MRNGNKTFVIVGTDHDLQKPESSSTFAGFVLELCRHYKVDFVGEEANGMESTHAKSVSSLVGAKWANVDITQKERESMRLGSAWDASLSTTDSCWIRVNSFWVLWKNANGYGSLVQQVGPCIPAY
jgi:hypothetical protein